MKSIKNKALKILRLLPLILCAVFITAYFMFGENISAESVLSFAPENILLAALFLIFLYAVKSLSVFFPVAVLYVAGGFLFSPVIAIAVNTVGVLAELAAAYLVGLLSGADFAERLFKKYPKFKEVIDNQQGSTLFLSFFLRVISCLPCDAVSMYFGAVKADFIKFLTGGILGMFPGLVMATLVGTSITDPSSPMFWGSIIVLAVISATSFIGYALWGMWRKRNIKK